MLFSLAKHSESARALNKYCKEKYLTASRVSSQIFFGALAAFCVVYNRTEHDQGFFICLLKTKWYFLHVKNPGLTRQFPTLQEYRESKTRLEEMVDELKKELSTAEHNLQKYNMETKVLKLVKAVWHPPTKTSNQLACRPANNIFAFQKKK